MKKIILSLAILLAISTVAFAQGKAKAVGKTPAKTVESASVKAVRATFEKLIEGIKESDADKVMSVYEKSDKILFFNNNGSATIGWEQDKKNREARYPKITNVTLDVTGLRIEVFGTTAAYVTCKWKQKQDFDGVTEFASGRMTLVLKLIGKEWKIVHLHTSPDNPLPTRPVFPSERTTEN